MNKVFGVTGGRGFIGTYVAREVSQGVELFLGDDRDPTAMIELAAPSECVCIKAVGSYSICCWQGEEKSSRLCVPAA